MSKDEAPAEDTQEIVDQPETPAEERDYLTNKELTVQVARLSRQLTKLTHNYNNLVNHINNLHENPAFVGGVLAHINELNEAQSIFFIQYFEQLPEHEQKQCYRCKLVSKDLTNEEMENTRPENKVDLTMEVYNSTDDEWEIIVDTDPVQQALHDSIIQRLIVANAPLNEYCFVGVQVIAPATEAHEEPEG